MKHLLIEIIKPFYYFLGNKNIREFYRLWDKFNKIPRFKYTSNVKFLDYVFDVPDVPSFIWQFKDIFVDEVYRFEPIDEKPIIFDCGANIGMSLLYFARNYKNAKIVAFEADREIAKICKQNLLLNGINNIEIIDKAVWINDKGIRFLLEGADGGRITTEASNSVQVESIRLKDYIEKFDYISFLKMDVEGAECEIIKDCQDVIWKVRKIFIEFHSLREKPQRLSEILSILEKNGFRYYIENVYESKKSPFITISKSGKNMELQLNIYGIRQ